MSGMFYFIAYVNDRKAITVIDLNLDLDECVSYERGDWDCVNDDNYFDHAEAIGIAKFLAVCKGVEYLPFESRYDESLNEVYCPLLDALKETIDGAARRQGISSMYLTSLLEDYIKNIGEL